MLSIETWPLRAERETAPMPVNSYSQFDRRDKRHCSPPQAAAMRRLMRSADSHLTMSAPQPQSRRSFMLKQEACGRKKRFSVPSPTTSLKLARRPRCLSRSDKTQRSGVSGELNSPSIGTTGSWCHPCCMNQSSAGITTCWGTPEP